MSITVTGSPEPHGAGLLLGPSELSTAAPVASHSSSGCGLAGTSVFDHAHTAGKLTSVRARTHVLQQHTSTCLHPSRDRHRPPPGPEHHHPPQPSQVGSCGSVHCRPLCLMLSCPIPGNSGLISLPSFRGERGQWGKPFMASDGPSRAGWCVLWTAGWTQVELRGEWRVRRDRGLCVQPQSALTRPVSKGQEQAWSWSDTLCEMPILSSNRNRAPSSLVPSTLGSLRPSAFTGRLPADILPAFVCPIWGLIISP